MKHKRHRYDKPGRVPPPPKGGGRPEQCVHCDVWRCKMTRSSRGGDGRVIVPVYGFSKGDFACGPADLVSEWAETYNGYAPLCARDIFKGAQASRKYPLDGAGALGPREEKP